MKKIPPLTKKRRSLAELTPESLAAALYHRELAEVSAEGVQHEQVDREPAHDIQQGSAKQQRKRNSGAEVECLSID